MSIPNAAKNPSKTRYPLALALMTLLFFMWGFLTALNDILVPHLKSLFRLNYAHVLLIQFSFFLAYAVMSIPMSLLIKKLDYKLSIVLGLFITALGCMLFIPAAHLAWFWMFLLALFVLATGIVILQVAANPYVALLGKPETASSRLTFVQGINTLGDMIAPWFGKFFILSTVTLTAAQIAVLSPQAKANYETAIVSSIQRPYLLLTIILLILAVIFIFYRLPSHVDENQLKNTERNHLGLRGYFSVWKYPRLLLGAIAIFVYVGAEVSAGSLIINYLGLPVIAGMAAGAAAIYVSFYWGGSMVGRFLGSWILKYIPAPLVVMFNATCSILLLIISLVFSGHISMWAIVLLGLFNSIQFPTIFSLAIEGLGDLTSYGSGVLCTAIVGGAVIPELQGILADRIGLKHSFLLLIFCYLIIFAFGWWVRES